MLKNVLLLDTKPNRNHRIYPAEVLRTCCTTGKVPVYRDAPGEDSAFSMSDMVGFAEVRFDEEKQALLADITFIDEHEWLSSLSCYVCTSGAGHMENGTVKSFLLQGLFLSLDCSCESSRKLSDLKIENSQFFNILWS